MTEMGWSGTGNGELLRIAADAGFETLITVDKNIEFQQNLNNLPTAIIILSTPRSVIDYLTPLIPEVISILARISHQYACWRLKHICCQYVTLLFTLWCHHTLRLMRPRWSLSRLRARASSTIATAMVSVAGTRRRDKSGAIIASIGEICGLEAGPDKKLMKVQGPKTVSGQ